MKAATPFSTILIANRGEIACRVIRTAKAHGYRTVAVYSEADAGALHVALADEATCIGPAPVRDSYLRIDSIIAAAKRTGAEAIHPGYGFLSENDEFARACQQAQLIFIGPPPEAIRRMGNKAAAKRLMIEAGVPTIPGWQEMDQSEESIAAAAHALGFPLLIKAAAGGGGRGMRLVRAADELLPSLRTAKAEAESAFGSGEVILERALMDARHVEIQVFGDSHGNVVHLGERDCSIQRRHQKIVEESPSPAVSAELRARMGAAGVAAAKSIGYSGAGTVEFLLDSDGSFYFLEMNTRLQVEHPVTECVTGLDLVALQLDVASGKPLPFSQEDIRLAGHAIEVRLYAEDPDSGFLPQTGPVLRWQPGVESPANGMRVDHGLMEGQQVSPFYDPMLAKLIAHGADREEARRRVLRLLEDTTLLGTVTNKSFLCDVLSHPAFARGEATTRFIPTHFTHEGHESPSRPAPRPTIDAWAWAVAAALLSESNRGSLERASTGASSWPLRIAHGAEKRDAIVRIAGTGQIEVTMGGSKTHLRIVSREKDRIRVQVDDVIRTVRFARQDSRLFLDLGRRTALLEEIASYTTRREAQSGDGRIVAAMNGRIAAVLVEAGADVTRGQPLLILEAMKMQHQVVSDTDGTVAEVLVAQNDQVATRKLLARVTPRRESGVSS